MSETRHRRAWPWVVIFAAIALVVVFYGVGAWYFSGQIYADALKSEPYDPTAQQTGTVLSVSADGSTITVQPTADADGEVATTFDHAEVGLAIGETLVVAGPVESADGGAQTRRVMDVIGDPPAVGDEYGLTRDVWRTPDEAGLEYEDITLTTLDGQKYPTWLIPGKGVRRWAILTHGKGAARSEMLRMARPLHEAGYNVLVVTYDGDVGAPAYADGMVTYGREEWPVVETAVRYASERGGKRIVLGGASHGGAVTLGFLARGTVTSRVSGVILDAPAASLGDVIDEAAESRSLPVVGLPIPESLESAAKAVVAWRYGVDFAAIDYTDKAGLVDVPLLTFQGTDDQTVPRAATDRFMRRGSGREGTYVLVDGAAHVESWNVDPEGYEEAVATFLNGLGTSAK